MEQKVTLLIDHLTHFKLEMQLLRSIVNSCELIETYKWKQPVYTHNDKNVVAIASFKNYCAVTFFKGSLLTNNKQSVEIKGGNAQYLRILRFTDLSQIKKNEALIKACILEAIAIEKAGKKVTKITTTAANYPEALVMTFKEDKPYQKAFEALTPGRQRAYIIHIDGAKQEATKFSRIASNRKRILAGYGMNDCTCGLTKRKPGCDGSHKSLGDYRF